MKSELHLGSFSPTADGSFRKYPGQAEPVFSTLISMPAPGAVRDKNGNEAAEVAVGALPEHRGHSLTSGCLELKFFGAELITSPAGKCLPCPAGLEMFF